MTAAVAAGPWPTPARVKVSRTLGSLVVVIAGVAVLGWYTATPRLTQLLPAHTPMKPNTALCLLLLASTLLFSERLRGARLAAIAAVVAVSGFTLIEVLADTSTRLDVLLPGTSTGGLDPRMAPPTAVCLLLLSVSATAALRGAARVQVAAAAGALLQGYVALIGYAFGASNLYTIGRYSSIALPTAGCLVMLALSLVVRAPGRLAELSSDRGAAGQIVRTLLPFLVVAPAVLGYLRLQGQRAGWYDTAFGTAIVVTSLTVTSLGLLLWTAARVSRVERDRDAANAQYAELNQQLERRVLDRTLALERVSAHFQAAFEASPLGSVLTDMDGVIQDVNPELERLTGAVHETLSGTQISTLFDDDRDAEDAALRELLGSGSNAYQIERRLRSDAEECWVLVHGALVREHGTANGMLFKLQDVTRRKNAEERAHHMALHDALTELPNRLLLLDRLSQVLKQAARTGRGVGVLFLDLDRFKTINDTLGHSAGDGVLRAVASRLSRAARAVDTVARLGGDEFVVICPDVGSERDVIELAAKLREELTRPIDLEGQSVTVDASVGVAFGVGHDAPEELIRRADQAMYRAKDSGRARYEVYDDDLRSLINHRLDTEILLRGAVERDEVENWFQPVVDLATGAPVATEALARWRRPDGHLAVPADFIAIAEETGVIKELGRHVLDTACREAASHPGDVAVSVNVSARQFVRSDFVAQVEHALAVTGLAPDRLWLELTESAVVEAIDSAARSFAALRRSGVKLAVDDFGTGYSSFLQLRQFNVDLLKIDMTFVTTLTSSPRERGLVAAMLQMADTLGLEVIAEGIENTGQRDILLDMGCQYGQGFLYARPSPVFAPQVTPLLPRRSRGVPWQHPATPES